MPTRQVIVGFLTLGLAFAAPLGAQDASPIAPFRVADNLSFVGDSEIGVYLLTGNEGHILLDTGFERMFEQVTSSIAELGFDVSDVRLIVSSHAHLDHTGGHAAMKRRTGAQVLAMEGDVAMLGAGGVGDPVLGDDLPFPPVEVDRLLADGEVVALGDIKMTAHLTAGHTEGCTSWSMELMVDGEPRTTVFNCSLSILDSARLTGPEASYEGIADDYRRSFARLRGLQCEVFLGSHGSFFGLEEKLAAHQAGAAANPFVDPEGCAAYVDRAEQNYLERLAGEEAPGR